MWWQALIKPITGIVKTVIDRKKEKAQAKHERAMAVIGNQARLAESTEEHNHAWEMANLQDKDVFLRKFSFFLFTYPIIAVVINPDYGVSLFASLELVPEWLLKIWVYMIGGVWGIAAIKNNASEIISKMGKRR